MPLVPSVQSTEALPDFLQKARSYMITVSLLAILTDLIYLLDLELIYSLLDVYQDDQAAINMWTIEARETLQKFILEAQTALLAEPGIRYLQHSQRITNDPIWCTTSCGITTKRTLLNWFVSSIKKIDPAVYIPILNTVNRSTLSVNTISPDSDTCTSYTTVNGPAGNADVAASIGTHGTTLTDGLLQHAKSKQRTGCASSVIYVSDGEGSYKYASETRSGDIQLDFRVYPMTAVMTEKAQDLWRHSTIHGKIALKSETPKDTLMDPVYKALQNLIKAIQNTMIADRGTEITRLASQWKKSSE